MTAQETLLRKRTPLFALSALLMSGACGGDKKHDPHADKDAGTLHMDAGNGDGDSNDKPDAGDGDGDSGMQGPDTCGPTDKICSGATPACVNGECVECSGSDTSQCAANEGCDPATHTCVRNAPFALDCADLPTDGACHGGPREVILVSERSGLIVMLDPTDGHFLGYFKRSNIAGFGEGTYWHATQGPDQCIWTVHDNDHAIERWDTDGSFKDKIIPKERYFDGQDDLIQYPHCLAFSSDRVYVSSTMGDPHPRVVSFELDGLTADAAGNSDITLDDGSVIESFFVLGDKSLVASNRTTKRIEHIPAGGGKAEPLVAELSNFDASQVSYAGAGTLITADSESGGAMYVASIATGMGTSVVPYDNSAYISGTGVLGNGKWLFTADAQIDALDPKSKNPTGQHVGLWKDPAVTGGDFKFIGRACLSNEFVESRASKPAIPDTMCDAPAGTVVFSENFDDGKDFTGSGADRNYNGFYDRNVPGVTVSIETGFKGAEDSSGSIKVLGAPEDSANAGQPDPTVPSGVTHALDHLKPSYVGYYVRVDVANPWAGYFSLNTRLVDSVESIYFSSDEGADVSTVQTYDSNVKSPEAVAQTWMRIQMRNIDWDARTYDLYVDCQRVGEAIQFPPGGAPDVHSVELSNLWPTDVAWFDQIVMIK